MKKILVVQVAGLGADFTRNHGLLEVGGLRLQRLDTVFPAVTCTAQATMRTASLPCEHGMVANGFFDNTLQRGAFWEQSARLVEGPRVWQEYQQRGGRVGLTFFQQSLGEAVDWIVSPAPIHKHSGGMIMGCYSKPAQLYAQMEAAAGRPFKLHQYWGPLASARSSAWIATAVSKLLARPDAPGVLFTYLPGLDYDLQRFGPADRRSQRALLEVQGQLELLLQAAQRHGYEVLIYGDYAITEAAHGAIFPNRVLRQHGLFSTRQVRRMTYPDFYQSQAFALVDHQVALVQCFDHSVLEQVRALLSSLAGVDVVLDREQQKALGVAHEHAGDLLVLARSGYWFAYHWWEHAREAPDYARHVDIHNKPGFDACELFFGRTPMESSLDTSRVKGTHGRVGPGCEVVSCSTCGLQGAHLLELAQALAVWLGQP